MISRLSFEDSVHHYCCIRDVKIFASEVTDKFLGRTMNDAILEGNPFVWVSEEWQLPEDFQVCDDFPDLNVWTANLSAAMLNLCFRHESSRSNLEKEVLKRNEESKNEEEENDMGEDMNQHGYNGQEGIYRVNRSIHNLILDEFPQVPHHVIITETVRQFGDALTIKLRSEIPNFSSTDIYRNNKKSLRFILEQLSSSKFVFHNELCSALYVFPLKSTQILNQVSNINDGIRIIRHLSNGQLKFQPYVKINDEDFDNSQDTVTSNSQEQVENTTVSATKSTRSCD